SACREVSLTRRTRLLSSVVRRRRTLVDVVLCPIADLTDDGRADVAALSRAVYPPAVSAAWPGRHLEWSAHESAVLIRAADGELICYVGLVVRSALHDGRSVRLGGLGGGEAAPPARPP